VGLEARTLVIPDSKNGKSRQIPLSSEAIDILHPLSATDGRLFPITGNGFRLAWERLRRRAGIEDLHFHDLRHEAISRFFEMGLSVPEVALISGHREVRMLFRYTHPMRQGIIAKMDTAPGTQDVGHGEEANSSQI
jgi:integrase